MQFFKNLNIGKRLAISLTLIGALLLSVAIISIIMLGRLNLGTTNIVENNLVQLQLSNQMISNANDIAISLRNMAMSDDPSDRKAQDQIVHERRADMLKNIAALEQFSLSGADKDLLAKIAAANTEYAQGQEEMLKHIAQSSREDTALYLTNKLRPVFRVLKDRLLEKIASQNVSAKEAGAAANATYANARLIMIVLALAAIALAALLGYVITTSITRPLARALHLANTVAEGDLSSVITVDTRDETGLLLQALKTMNERLAATVSQVRSGTDNIAMSASEVAAGSMDLSSRTEQQASSLEETASSMEELTSTVKQNTDNARQAYKLAESASSIAQRGGQMITQVVTTMDQINQSSGKIASIIGVIDGIAFQTNILALNAAVEAARAGEQGRGFAVVATEVRNLAQRSAAAAKEIKSLIDDSTSTVENGSKLVSDAGTTMGELVDSVRRVTDIVSEITSASVEQSAGIEQINQAVIEMDNVTQQNAALVEQSAAAAAAMQNQAEALATAVSVFKLGASGQVVPATVVSARKPAAPAAGKPRAAQIAAPRSASARAASPKLDDEWETF
ncbi:methyl-accepting chemotaxis protein [Janthinobacterium aquaticum]|uniref:methyl-accepting chemotaxis protein n=1 Tax=Janthinobacterium sp. FT58W TaxID=2654254 RepID=UPI001264CABD|nr:methyl-accepting chemotaxis protein [Janthinobacterium sp. FT58W]KAB8044942.1 HAMP domain-containing protein [Janthinobacterium sp. FT58W]